MALLAIGCVVQLLLIAYGNFVATLFSLGVEADAFASPACATFLRTIYLYWLPVPAVHAAALIALRRSSGLSGVTGWIGCAVMAIVIAASMWVILNVSTLPILRLA
jgi:hypothetical protein